MQIFHTVSINDTKVHRGETLGSALDFTDKYYPDVLFYHIPLGFRGINVKGDIIKIETKFNVGDIDLDDSAWNF